MKNIIQIIMICTGLLQSQTSEQIKKAREVIQRTGMSESQAKAAAKAQGYSDMQINNAIEKIKSSKANLNNPILESSEKTGLPDIGKSNQIHQGESHKESIIEEQSFILDEDDLEIVDGSEINIESEEQPVKER